MTNNTETGQKTLRQDKPLRQDTAKEFQDRTNNIVTGQTTLTPGKQHY